MFDINNIKITRIDRCYPDNIYLFLNDILIKGYFCNNQPYKVISHGFIYDITVNTYAIMSYKYKLFISDVNSVHDRIFQTHYKEFKDIKINDTIRKTKEIKQQSRAYIYTIKEQQGCTIFNKYKLFLLILWNNDYENWIKPILLQRFGDCDKYFIITGYDKGARMKDMLSSYNVPVHKTYSHPLDKLDIIAKYHYNRYVGD